MRTPKSLLDPNYKCQHLDRPGNNQRQPTERTVFVDDTVSLWGWPSRGGLIVLEQVTALDFKFLNLDSIHPPMSRDPDQEAEDIFCQRLLLLGAKWFETHDRYGFVFNVAHDGEPELEAIEAGVEPPPNAIERRWVSLGYPDGPDGGFWIAECDTILPGWQEKDNLLPSHACRVRLAQTMQEKCQIMKELGAKFYPSLDQYDGAACLNAWEEKNL